MSTGVVLSVEPATLGVGGCDGATAVTVTGTLNHANPRLVETAVTLTVGATADDSATEGTDYGTIGGGPHADDRARGQASGTQTFTLLPTDDDVAGADMRR